jgi:membrane-associated phospholipid phosphatase
MERYFRKLNLREEITLTKLLIAFVVFWVPVIIFVQLASEVGEHGILSFDAAILHVLHGIASPALNQVMVIITNTASALAIVSAIILGLIWLLRAGRKNEALGLLFGVGGAALVNGALKLSFQRARPSLWIPIVTEKSYSFPSGHAMMSSALAFSMILLFWKTRWRWYVLAAGVAYTLLVGTSRVYLGVHYPTDVLAGWCVSLVWIMLVHAVMNDFWLRRPGNAPLAS